MLKASATASDGRPIMLFGLSELNVSRLKKGQPIYVDAEAAGLPFKGEIVIFYGKTEHDMLEEMSAFIGPHTKLSIDPRSL